MRRKVFLFITTVLTTVTSALASPADAAERMTIPSWDGVYLGLALGGRATDVLSTTTLAVGTGGSITPSPDSAKARFDSVAGRIGGYLGYNWQFAPTWVAGLEGDFGWANSRQSVFGLPGSVGLISGAHVIPRPGDGVDFKASWDASIRGRLGYLVNPALLVYGTGGVAWQRYVMTASCGGLCIADLGIPEASDTHSATRLGYTVGGGMEVMLSGHWLARVEYRYADFGTWRDTFHADASHFANVEVDLKTHTALFGLAYKLGPNVSNDASSTYALASAAPAPSWNGYYLGLALGGRSSASKWTTTSIREALGNVIFEPDTKDAVFDNVAARYGGYVGANWRFAPMWVAGIEADLGWADRTRSVNGLPGTFGEISGNTLRSGDSVSLRSTWDASLRGRIGFLATPSFLAYATAGPTWLHLERSLSCGGTCTSNIGGLPTSTTSESTTKFGWTIGGGIETAVVGNWLARAEYRYADYGTWATTWSLAPTFSGAADIKLTTHTALVGLAYSFDRFAAMAGKP